MRLKQYLINLGDRLYYKKLEDELKGMESVLDLGCGSCSPLAKIKKDFFSVGVDIFKPSIEESKKKAIHDKYKLGDVLKINNYFKKKSFDVVIALDLIEHLKKEEGSKLLEKMEQIAIKKIIILTPNGFYKQDSLEDNAHQVHQSGWGVEDFRGKNFHIYGMRGLKFLRGECATIKFKPWFFWGVISTISQPVFYFMPKLAYQLFIVKELKTK